MVLRTIEFRANIRDFEFDAAHIKDLGPVNIVSLPKMERNGYKYSISDRGCFLWFPTHPIQLRGKIHHGWTANRERILYPEPANASCCFSGWPPRYQCANQRRFGWWKMAERVKLLVESARLQQARQLLRLLLFWYVHPRPFHAHHHLALEEVMTHGDLAPMSRSLMILPL